MMDNLPLLGPIGLTPKSLKITMLSTSLFSSVIAAAIVFFLFLLSSPLFLFFFFYIKNKKIQVELIFSLFYFFYDQFIFLQKVHTPETKKDELVHPSCLAPSCSGGMRLRHPPPLQPPHAHPSRPRRPGPQLQRLL